MNEELQAELDFLRWYASHVDFGPADGDCQIILREQYEKETGKKVPEAWRYE